MSTCNTNSKSNELKFFAWDISIPLPTSPNPNSIYIVRDGTTYTQYVVDGDGNYLTPVSSGSSTTPASDVYGSELNVFSSSTILTNSTDTLQDAINVTTSSLPIGRYTVSVSYSWNSNCSQSDFESYLFIGGAAIGADSSGIIHREEPANTAGNWNNTGSLQMMSFKRDYTLTLTTAGTRTIQLAFRSSKNNVMASIWDVDIKIFRIN